MIVNRTAKNLVKERFDMNLKTDQWLRFIQNVSPAWTSYQILVFGFAILIFTGSLLLSFPFASQSGEAIPYIDALFTATSAVCVTGLTIADTGSYFSAFGQVVIISLIQIGGLGIMTATTLIAVLLGKKIHLKERLMIQESFAHYNSNGVIRLVLYVIKLTLVIELIGGIILTIFLFPDYGLKAIYLGIWHSISSFCNAGFDILGHGNSYVGYVTNVGINLTLVVLIIIGSLGFFVISDIFQKKKWEKLEVQSKLILTVTASLLVIGTVMIFLLERTNPETLGDLPLYQQLLASFTQTVSRTAGVATVDISLLRAPTFLFIMVLMFIGASPGSTGGGIKTNTFGIIIASAVALIKGQKDTVVFHRRIPGEFVYRSFVIFFISVTLVLVITWFLTIFEDQPFLLLLFEATSAFSTAGLSTTVSANLSIPGKLLIILTMFLGRVGMLTFVMSFSLRRKQGLYRYPSGKFRIG